MSQKLVLPVDWEKRVNTGEVTCQYEGRKATFTKILPNRDSTDDCYTYIAVFPNHRYQASA